MALWLVRAGSHGEYEQKFLSEGRIYVTWDSLDVDLSSLPSREALQEQLARRYPNRKAKTLLNWTGQIWRFNREMKVGDLVALPLKSQPAISIGEIKGEYHFEPDGPDPYFHWREVDWIADSVPREHFGQDLLYSLGAFLTICRIQRNEAEARVRAMRRNGWAPETISAVTTATQGSGDVVEEGEEGADLEELAQDQIAKLISAKFKGHEFTRLVEAVLQAQGYTTWRSPPGADQGADILAGAGPLGFSAPRLVVEVKSDGSPVDRPTVDKLLGAVSKFSAEQGLFVAWGGFRTTVPRDLAASFFRLRLWSRRDFLEQLFEHYHELDDDIRADLPLKRIWTVATPDEE